MLRGRAPRSCTEAWPGGLCYTALRDTPQRDTRSPMVHKVLACIIMGTLTL